MNNRFAAISVWAALAMGAGAAALPAASQEFRGGQRLQQGGQDPQMGAPMLGLAGIPNPLQANPLGLLQRSEVQSHIGLDLRQKNALAEVQGESAAATRQKIQQATQGVNDQQLRAMTPEQRRARMQELRPQLQATTQAAQGELTDKIKEILKPEQVTRLYQLDRQRRGPLALADPKVAQEVKLTPEHRQAIQQIQQESQQQQSEVIRGAFESMRENQRQGQPPRFPDFTSRLSPLKQKLDKVRKAAEQKTLESLSLEESAAWKAVQGEPFTFRTDPPAQPGQFGPARRGG